MASSSSSAADSYIGSLICLTSKSEIRYEGILYNINTDEASIGLRNVRSFGTEGRKKDGPQVPASDKIYDYILFRGSDIKDLQVKAAPPAQTTTIHNDPAIIQSHFSRPISAPVSLPSGGSGTVADLSSHTAELGLPRSTFPSGLPLYQPGGGIGSWVPPQPPLNASGSGLAMPMYWQGFYSPSGGLPHLQQSPLLRPSMLQPFQYPGINQTLQSGSPNVSELSSSLLPPASSNQFLSSSTLPSIVAPRQASVLAPETATGLMPNKPLVDPLAATNLGAGPFILPLSSSHDPAITMSQNMPPVVSSNSSTVIAPTLVYQTMSQSVPSVVDLSSQNQVQSSVDLVTPGQLLQPGPSTLPSSEPLPVSHKSEGDKPHDANIKPSLPASSVSSPAVAKEPILPLPKPSHQKPNGAAMQNYNHVKLQNQYYNRGRGRGRGRGRDRGRGRGRENGYSHPVSRFTEDFDFMAMNEKFNKDEVWGHLGKTKEQSHNMDGDGKEHEADDNEEHDAESQMLKPVYVKDEFFDTLSCNTLDHANRGGRIKFSEQLKIDTETFGDFPRHGPAQGGGRGFHGRGWTRGPHNGRGYGYVVRGRGRSV